MSEPRRASSNAKTSNTARQRTQYTRPNTTVKTDRSAKGNINSGLTEAQRKAVTAWEDKNRDYKTEHMAVIDENGVINPKGKAQYGSGSRTRARVNPAAMVENGVVIHNHPSDRAGIAGRVGVPLSGPDVRLAMKYNLSEIRAVTPHYTYSIRRPAGGWKGNYESVQKEFMNIATREAGGLYQSSMRVLNANGGVRGQDAEIYNNRINTLSSHRALQELAKKYGFTYTRRRTR